MNGGSALADAIEPLLQSASDIASKHLKLGRVTLLLNKPKLDNLASDIWKSAERLRGKFKSYEHQNVTLPIIVIRRRECVLIDEAHRSQEGHMGAAIRLPFLKEGEPDDEAPEEDLAVRPHDGSCSTGIFAFLTTTAREPQLSIRSSAQETLEMAF